MIAKCLNSDKDGRVLRWVNLSHAKKVKNRFHEFEVKLIFTLKGGRVVELSKALNLDQEVRGQNPANKYFIYNF